MNRRSLLQTVAGSAALGLAGCLDADDEPHATLQRLYLLNARSEATTMALAIARTDTDETVHEDTHELPPGGDGFDGETMDCVWPDAPLEIAARRAGEGEWTHLETAGEEGCLLLIAEVNQQRTAFYSSLEECPVRDPDCHGDVGW